MLHGGSMSEAKMKATRGNGTPHPKGRRFSNEENSHYLQIQHDEPCQAIRNQTRSSLQKLLDVHTQVAQTLQQIDATLLNIHKLASSNHVADAEVQVFTDALANMDANLQELNSFLRATAERSSSLLGNFDQELLTTGSLEATPPRGDKGSRVSSCIPELELGAISSSPLVATDVIDCESGCDSEFLTCTPPGDEILGTHRSTSFSPLPQTPCLLSPPRSTTVLSTVSESPSPLVLFPVDGDGPQTPRSGGPLTPEFSSISESRLMFETPPAHVSKGGDGLLFLQTPEFGVSPPRFWNPGETVPSEIDDFPPTPAMSSPLRTSGILLECSTESRESSLAGSPAIFDDLTTSTVKRLGPNGLEERLWEELATHKADVIQILKFR